MEILLSPTLTVNKCVKKVFLFSFIIQDFPAQTIHITGDALIFGTENIILKKPEKEEIPTGKITILEGTLVYNLEKTKYLQILKLEKKHIVSQKINQPANDSKNTTKKENQKQEFLIKSGSDKSTYLALVVVKKLFVPSNQHNIKVGILKCYSYKLLRIPKKLETDFSDEDFLISNLELQLFKTRPPPYDCLYS